MLFCLSVIAASFLAGVAAQPLALAANPPATMKVIAADVAGPFAELNGSSLAPGATLYPGDTVKLGARSSAALQFENDLVLAAPLTELVVQPGGVGLQRGSVQLRVGGDYSLVVSAPFFQVRIASGGGASGSAEVRVGGTKARVAAIAGVTEVTPTGHAAPYLLYPGQVATMDSAAPQEGLTPSAGYISRLLPDVFLRRMSMEEMASEFIAVYWKDELRSGAQGRARISLNDGSLLSLGSDSVLNVGQHEALSQQTTLDLIIGRMRGRVMKLTRPGAKFEVRTPFGVAGLVGTDFYLLVTQDYVELIVFDGAVQFTTPAGQSVTATTGMLLRISNAGAFQGPTPATPEEIQEAKTSTDIPDIVQADQPQRKRRLAPVWVGITSGAAATGIGVALSIPHAVSPSAP